MKFPVKINTQRRPEAWHATVLKDEANNLLDQILKLKAVTDDSTASGTHLPDAPGSSPVQSVLPWHQDELPGLWDGHKYAAPNGRGTA